MNNSINKALVAVSLAVTALVAFAGAASAQAAPTVGETTTDALQSWSDQALDMWPAALAAGMALFGVTLLIRFGKRVFGVSK